MGLQVCVWRENRGYEFTCAGLQCEVHVVDAYPCRRRPVFLEVLDKRDFGHIRRIVGQLSGDGTAKLSRSEVAKHGKGTAHLLMRVRTSSKYTHAANSGASSSSSSS